MEKLRVAIIGQGRSGLNIHGKFFLSGSNRVVDVVAVVDRLEARREKAKKLFNCEVYADYKELFARNDIDLVVNATYSQMHAPITKDLLLHGFNVLSEKPFGATRNECLDLIRIAEEKGLVLAVFHQSLFQPTFCKIKEIAESGILGDIHQIDIRYNGFARRWDWQTLQCNVAGGVYNTGPHPIGQALALLGWDEKATVAYARMKTILTSGDANDYAKILLTAPDKPLIDIEVDSADAFMPYNYKIYGSKGTLVQSGKHYQMKYIHTEDLPPRPVIRESLEDANGNPIYCGEKLEWTTEEGDVTGTQFDSAVQEFYEMMYDTIRNGKPLRITPYMAAEVIRIIESCHAMNPLPVRFTSEEGKA